MKKRTISILLAAVLAAGTLAACGGSSSASEPAAEETTEEAAAEETTEEAAAEETKEEAAAEETAAEETAAEETAAEESAEGSVFNIYCWNEEFKSRITSHYPGYEEVDATTARSAMWKSYGTSPLRMTTLIRTIWTRTCWLRLTRQMTRRSTSS